jgi:fused signal recognition particle receptor
MSEQLGVLIVGAGALAVMVLFFLALRARRRRDRAEVERAGQPPAVAPWQPGSLPEPPAEADEEAEGGAIEALEEEEVPAPQEARVIPMPKPVGRALKDGLLKTREEGFISRLGRLFSGRTVDPSLLAEVEEVLLTADIGVKTAARLAEGLEGELIRGSAADADKAWRILRGRTAAILETAQAEHPEPDRDHTPHVMLIVGVNGSGKTTTIGKLSWSLVRDGKKVAMVAGDTFRAAAVDQLEIWARRAEASFHKGAEGADPASVVFEGVKAARDEGADIILVDTAGRLHTKVNLVEELKKVKRVMGKIVPGAPHETYLVLDATTGQNAIQQALAFREAVDIDGLVLTKLDGTAKGGVVIGIVDQLGLPIRYVGVGERPEDLRPFDPAEFVDALFPSA